MVEGAMPMIVVPQSEILRLALEQPGLIVDCAWCENCTGKKDDKQIGHCNALNVMTNTNTLRICSSYVERKS
jgi:hypothetical protein